jgi:hypothetical protein
VNGSGRFEGLRGHGQMKARFRKGARPKRSGDLHRDGHPLARRLVLIAPRRHVTPRRDSADDRQFVVVRDEASRVATDAGLRNGLTRSPESCEMDETRQSLDDGAPLPL